MEPFKTFKAIGVPIDIANCDTDQIIPVRFVRAAKDDPDYPKFLLHDLRFNAGALVPIDLDKSPVVLSVDRPPTGLGYIYSSDFTGSETEAGTPEEAANLMASRVDAAGDIWIVVYQRDGRDVIGQLRIAHVDHQ